MPQSTDLLDTYFVDRTQGCWLWLGSLDTSGYGIGNFPKVYGTNRAHRCSYMRHVGPIPKGLEIDHCCHNWDLACAGGVTCLHRRCINPEHLEPVTGYENTRRATMSRREAMRVELLPRIPSREEVYSRTFDDDGLIPKADSGAFWGVSLPWSGR